MSHIVLVDDDHDMREFVSDHLSARGFKIESFSSPVEAFKKLTEPEFAQQTDLVITDLSMPEIDGLDLIKNLKKVNGSIPVILITAFATIEKAVEATRAGAYDFISKPF